MITLNGQPLVQCERCNAVDGEQYVDWYGTNKTVTVSIEDGLCAPCYNRDQEDLYGDGCPCCQ